jgi:glycosyltransferase involved in cell wall biosynthesis
LGREHLRIVHILSDADPRHGGPVSALCGLAEAQARIGMDVSVLATFRRHSDTTSIQRLKEKGIQVQLVGPSGGPLDRARDLNQLVEAVAARASVLHIHGLWQEIQHLAARHAASQRVPCVIRPCGMLSPWSLAQSRLRKRLYCIWRLRRMLSGVAAIHFTSEAERTMASPLRLLPPTIVEPNGIDLEQFVKLPARGEFRRRHGIPDEQQIVMFLGRLHLKKGPDLLIRAFAVAESAALLVLAGPDAHGTRRQLEKIARECGVADRVLFTGMLEPRYRTEALVDAEVFALPSQNENFGIAVAEALAARLPVVVSDQVALAPDVVTAAAGSVVSCDVEPLAAEIKRWLADPRSRREAGESGRAYVFSRFDWISIAERWRSHYGALRQESRSFTGYPPEQLPQSPGRR